MTTYYYLLASQKFLTVDEPVAEVFKERTRYYQEQEQEIDFWLVINPAFLNVPAMQSIKSQCPQPSAAVISTNKQFISWLKLRLEFVITGEFTAASVAEAITTAGSAAA
jgi:hypothetical protein